MHIVKCLHVDVEGRWLVGRRPEGKVFEGLWEFPGGALEQGETSKQAAVREIREEFGSKFKVLEILPPVRLTTEGTDIITIHGVFGILLEPKFTAVHSELKRMYLHDIRELAMTPADQELVRNLLKVRIQGS